MFTVGLYLKIDPDTFDLVLPEIESMCDIDIEVMDQESGRLLVSVSGDDERADKQLVDKLKSLPFVMAAEVIYFHYYNEGNTDSEDSTEDTTDKPSHTYKSYNYIIHTQH